MCYTTDNQSNSWKFIGRRFARIVGVMQSFDPYTELPSVYSAYLYMIVRPMMLLFGSGMIAASVYKYCPGYPAGYNIAVFYSRQPE